MDNFKHAVDRFLAWPLPESVCSDACASIPNYPHRSGTTLLTATEAEQMIRHVAAPFVEDILRYRVVLERIAANGGASPGDKKHLWAAEALKDGK